MVKPILITTDKESIRELESFLENIRKLISLTLKSKIFDNNIEMPFFVLSPKISLTLK